MPRARIPSRDAALLALIGGIAIILALASYQNSLIVTEQIKDKAVTDIRLNTEVQADGLSKILINKVSAINNNLRVLSNAQAFQNPDLFQTAKIVLSATQDTTKDLTQFYMWLDSDGKMLWLSNINQTTADQYIGTDLSQRDYFVKAKETGSIYYSTAIVSNDDVSRLYISSPIFDSSGSFKGVLATGIDLQVLGKYVESQLSPKSQSSIGMMDRGGVILYSADLDVIGTNVFAEPFQSRLPDGLKEPFNNFLHRSLAGGSGAEDISFEGNSGTLAYQTVSIDGKDIVVLYVVTQHTLSSDFVSIIDQQRNLTIAIILAVGASAVGMGLLVLSWNRQLNKVVLQKTRDLSNAIDSLEAANQRLATNDKVQKEFVNIAAHELRTPVQPLLSIAEQLEDDLSKDIEVKLTKPEIEIVARNAKRLARLTSDILEVSRIESNSLKLRREEFDLREKIRNVIEDTRSFIEDETKLHIVFEPPAEPVIVEADKSKLFEVTSNLLSNAIKFTKEGTIIVTLEKNDGFATVTIKDSGLGIDPEITPKLFTKFTTKSESGTGLGLYISKSIIESHDGKIWGTKQPRWKRSNICVYHSPEAKIDSGAFKS